MYTKTRGWRTAVMAVVVVLVFTSFAYVGFIAGNKVHYTSSVPPGKETYPLFPIGLFNDLLLLKS